MDIEKKGMLYLCPTPIGNLEDITYRVLETLKNADLIAAEDTRHSRHLLTHFDIKTPMTSYHEFNKIDKGHYLVDMMEKGTTIALISDAGSPGISDPGEELVKFCHEAGIKVSALPGPAACIVAVTTSGFSTRRFCFEGFLPQDKKEREYVLKRLETETRTTIFYEAPHRLLKTLEVLYQRIGNRRITFCRELTKRYETIMQTSLEDGIAYYKEQEPKGEFVLVIEGIAQEVLDLEAQESWESMSIEDHMDIYLKQGQSKKDAMKSVAKDRGITKRDVYQMLI